MFGFFFFFKLHILIVYWDLEHARLQRESMDVAIPLGDSILTASGIIVGLQVARMVKAL